MTTYIYFARTRPPRVALNYDLSYSKFTCHDRQPNWPEKHLTDRPWSAVIKAIEKVQSRNRSSVLINKVAGEVELFEGLISHWFVPTRKEINHTDSDCLFVPSPFQVIVRQLAHVTDKLLMKKTSESLRCRKLYTGTFKLNFKCVVIVLRCPWTFS